jgi:hypothetical protein
VAVRVDHLILLVLCLQPNNLKHTTMYLHLAVYTSVALIADIAWRRDDTADISRRRDDTAGVRAVVTALAVSVFRLTTPVTLRRPCRPRDHYHWVLQIVVAGSLTATVATDRRRLAQQCRTRWCAQ